MKVSLETCLLCSGGLSVGSEPGRTPAVHVLVSRSGLKTGRQCTGRFAKKQQFSVNVEQLSSSDHTCCRCQESLFSATCLRAGKVAFRALVSAARRHVQPLLLHTPPLVLQIKTPPTGLGVPELTRSRGARKGNRSHDSFWHRSLAEKMWISYTPSENNGFCLGSVMRSGLLQIMCSLWAFHVPAGTPASG